MVKQSPIESVLVVGYYGRGNFGDDVLMVAATRAVRRLFPQAEVHVRADGQLNYVQAQVGPDIHAVPYGTRAEYRVIVHGGGGTYFDFATHGKYQRLTQKVLLSLGPRPYVLCERLVRSLAGRPRVSAHYRVGLGLGIGTFSKGSPRLLAALPEMLDFTSVWVRDPESEENLRAIGMTCPVEVGSDLAFLSDLWCPKDLVLRKALRSANTKPRVGVIVRDWVLADGKSVAEEMFRAVQPIRDICDFTLISLDATADAESIAAARGFPLEVWRPRHLSIPDFLMKLSAQDAFITTRAHGAICGSVLGRPSIVVGIEPKLSHVHGMLPNATLFVQPDALKHQLGGLLNQLLAIPHTDIEKDVASCRAKSERALSATLGEVRL